MMPYGLENWHHPQKILFMMGFGLIFMVSYIALFAVPALLFPRLHKNYMWTLGRFLQTNVILMGVLIVFNWLYTAWITELIPLTPQSFVRIVVYSVVFEAWPLGILGLVPLRSRQPDRMPVYQIAERVKPIKLTADCWLHPHTFVYATSFQNYITLYSLENGKMKHRDIRFTMKELARLTQPYFYIRRCHKSYVVNLLHFDTINGKSENATLSSSAHESIVQVSRPHYRLITEILNQLPPGEEARTQTEEVRSLVV